MAETKAEKIIAWLKSIGSREVASRSKKYRQFTHQDGRQFYFVGKAGALRVGLNSSDSISLTGVLFR